MKRALLPLPVALAACVGPTHEVVHIGPNVRIADGGIRGGEAQASYAIDGIGFSMAATVDQYKRPVFDGEQTRVGGGIDIGMRVSAFGLVAKGNGLEHWFDIGAAAGAGGGLIYPARLTTYGEGWVGGWVAIGLWKGPAFPSLLVDLRRQAVSEWDNATIVSVGLAFTRRFTTARGFGFD